MTPAERLVQARNLATLAEELRDRNIPTPAGEMMWGALNHVITAILEHHGLVTRTGNPMTRTLVMEHLQQADPRDPPLPDALAVVAELHGHFYNHHMSDTRHAEAMTASFDLLEYLLARPEVLTIR